MKRSTAKVRARIEAKGTTAAQGDGQSPNAETLAAIQEAQTPAKLKRFLSFRELRRTI